MAQSLFKKHNLAVVQSLSDDLIAHMTQLEPESANFKIAQNFVMSNIQNNTFMEPNENQIHRSIGNLGHKFRAHNQPDRAERFQYLVHKFLKKPMKQVGISDSHMCMIQLLFLLANSPTGYDGYIGEDRQAFSLSTREYLTKEEAE
jgi:hypothetical protein